ncbi:unnamed protein product [Phytophthora fragariaefolia]|uniref:Unnamed protein product n=1 Tax=Phytophthora fragariaefolia TaxID=1490495 RepID=A0A9W6YQT2_9STRA|nr:unnamed protein product [Phytophthora fragariaefolia]
MTPHCVSYDGADASLDHWGSVLTQLPPKDAGKPLLEQRHQPLAFRCGHFRGESHRWPTIEKEAFALVESCKRLEYLLLQPHGFRLLTDHRDLVDIFNPCAMDSNMQRYQSDKLQCWAMSFTCFQYEIEHIRGEDNVWGDLLSRWGAPLAASRSARMHQLAIIDQWIVLDPDEASWKPAAVMYEDEPQLVRQFVIASPKNALARRIWAILAPENQIETTEIRQGGGMFWVVPTLRGARIVRPFVVYTDHASLRTAIKSPHISQRMARWLSFFAEYNFQVEYKPGRLNVVVDALSRRPDYVVHKTDANAIGVVRMPTPSSSLLDDVKSAYANDADAKQLLDYFATPSDKSRQKLAKHLYARVQ